MNAKEEGEATMDLSDIFDQDNQEEEDIYCAKCFQIPKYTIIIGKDNIFFPFDKKPGSYTL